MDSYDHSIQNNLHSNELNKDFFTHCYSKLFYSIWGEITFQYSKNSAKIDKNAWCNPLL